MAPASQHLARQTGGPAPEMYRTTGLIGPGHHFVMLPAPDDQAPPKTLAE